MNTIREVISALKQCYNYNKYETLCDKCYYFANGKNCREDMIKDAITFLKKEINMEE